MERGRTVTPLARAPSPLTPPPSPSRSSCRLLLSLLHFCEPFRRMHGLALGGTHTHTSCPFISLHAFITVRGFTHIYLMTRAGMAVWHHALCILDSIQSLWPRTQARTRVVHPTVLSAAEREWVKGWDYTNASKACTDCVMWGGVVVERVVVMARGCGSRLSAGNSRSSMHHGRCDHTWARSDVGLVRCGPRCVSVCEWT
jgi:hypothetical protein